MELSVLEHTWLVDDEINWISGFQKHEIEGWNNLRIKYTERHIILCYIFNLQLGLIQKT